jgi:uncharacterized membrane protein
MENEKVTPAETKVESKPAKPKKKECTAGQSTNLMFGCITLFVICAILIGFGLFFLIAVKAYFAGILILSWGVVFTVVNIVLNKNTLFKKKTQPANKPEENK